MFITYRLFFFLLIKDKHMKRIFIYLFFYLLSLQTLSAQFITDTVLTLQNIEIQGQRFPIINSGSVKQLSVQENITGGLGSASDVLRQLPAVTSDIEGTTYFRGSTKTTQLISGIPYGFMEEQGGDLLIQLPAFFFKRQKKSTEVLFFLKKFIVSRVLFCKIQRQSFI